ncbi:histidine triad nucleotide-binding protein [Catenulispora yoronensis]|uniref:Histidine triad nucleotide-binding protein n=1 Tax=Catenulispora yoronensis TaxID=450799 RepID=A0ABN2UFZ0_9ACTN
MEDTMADGQPVADCLFCKIVAGDIPAAVVRQTEDTVAFKDINPQADIHDLVVPRAHYANAAELAANAPELSAALLVEAGEVAKAEGIADDGYRVVFNTGAHAGQTVFHVHAHVLGGDFLSTFGN